MSDENAERCLEGHSLEESNQNVNKQTARLCHMCRRRFGPFSDFKANRRAKIPGEIAYWHCGVPYFPSKTATSGTG